MTTLTRPQGFLQKVAGFVARSRPSAQPRAATRDDTVLRREFVAEMMARNPDAFASELDVQSMMHCFPSRF
ncbi:hypothetical protein LGT41_0001880 [Abyssibius alkaniclasticus]|uniref:hypothetical protein n=1 Tax=Abyssibius alkaniclasticus TaxID=2881234 RepID=UPI0023643F39|nr:hypothetical protein [Abyssibius alkaniclasticus]UPH71587.1 hypothetical protein LGT41_0001880 [Abyssibius alkaniclasticus]|tara:strand:+ start:409 stop:621 length:213 start_codon:yes stop_codon:yes gene_type:complete